MLEEKDRKIALFGYEWKDAQNSILWKTPHYFSRPGGQAGKELDESFVNWQGQKRTFYLEELLTGHWIKIGDHGHSFNFKLQSGGGLQEAKLFHPQETWPGNWKLVDGVLRINVAEYELDVFAAREGVIHSGIEESTNNSLHRVYYKVIHLK
jgi:hypothetical protein